MFMGNIFGPNNNKVQHKNINYQMLQPINSTLKLRNKSAIFLARYFHKLCFDLKIVVREFKLYRAFFGMKYPFKMPV